MGPLIKPFLHLQNILHWVLMAPVIFLFYIGRSWPIMIIHNDVFSSVSPGQVPRYLKPVTKIAPFYLFFDRYTTPCKFNVLLLSPFLVFTILICFVIDTQFAKLFPVWWSSWRKEKKSFFVNDCFVRYLVLSFCIKVLLGMEQISVDIFLHIYLRFAQHVTISTSKM